MNSTGTTQAGAAWDVQPIAGLHLSGGVRSFAESERAYENLGPGMKLALLMEGSFSIAIDGRSHIPVSAATSNLFMSRGSWQLGHRFTDGTRLQYLTLFLDASLIEDVLEDDFSGLSGMGDVVHTMRGTPAAMTSLAAAILHRPFRGAAARLHDSGKALELAALALETLGQKGPRSQSSPASAVETRRLHQLRDFLDHHWREAPTADRLARDFGFGLRRMTAGFRRLFGCTIAEYLRELRLQEGWHLLSSGLSATLVAEQVGYTLPHFTVAFTRRFGITPGSLAGRGMS